MESIESNSNQDLFPIYIVSNHGTIKKSVLMVEDKELNVEPTLVWRPNGIAMQGSNGSSKLSCKFSFVRYIAEPQPTTKDESKVTIDVQINLFKLTIMVSRDLSDKLYSLLKEMHKKATKIANLEKAARQAKQFYVFRVFDCDAAVKEEQLKQLDLHLRFKEGLMIVEKLWSTAATRLVTRSFNSWIDKLKDLNNDKMKKDRHRWRLHAAANQEIDLQAWYHALFFQEVYRLRGRFFYKDAILPTYRQSYDLVDNALTPLEEAALAHVLCSPDTTYGDVAGQMFVVQAILPPSHFLLFQQLAAQGAVVVKHPRSGRPAKKLFRFSFVEGNIYLTWKGKMGNQGVGMCEVTDILGGIQTDVLRWSGAQAKAEQYLSVICADRSIDLFFDAVTERNAWMEVLKALVMKEQNSLVGVESIDPDADAEEFDWTVLYTSLCKVPNYN